MMSTLKPVDIFRARLRALVLEQFDGKYTVLAKRAGIPISTLEHTMLEAKRLPGGDVPGVEIEPDLARHAGRNDHLPAPFPGFHRRQSRGVNAFHV